MKERVFDFEEFKRRVDANKPIHWAVREKCVDPKLGVLYRMWLSITGLSVEGGHIVEFYQETTVMIADEEKKKQTVEEWKSRYVEPLKATPGEWM